MYNQSDNIIPLRSVLVGYIGKEKRPDTNKGHYSKKEQWAATAFPDYYWILTA